MSYPHAVFLNKFLEQSLSLDGLSIFIRSPEFLHYLLRHLDLGLISTTHDGLELSLQVLLKRGYQLFLVTVVSMLIRIGYMEAERARAVVSLQVIQVCPE